jgi:subtilase family serine protease
VALFAALLMGYPGSAAAAGSSPRITFFFGLRRPEASAIEAFYAVQRPGSPTYRRFMTPRQVAASYGAKPWVRDDFVRAIRAKGFSVAIDPSGVFARVSGSVARFERVFKVRIRHDAGDTANSWSALRRLRLPADMRSLVRDVVPAFERQYKHPPKRSAAIARSPDHAAALAVAQTVAVAARQPKPKRTGTWKQGCAKAKATGAFSYAQVRHAYGVDRLGSGAGASVAILGLEEVPAPQDIAANARCFGYPKLRSRILRTDGQRKPPRGLFEPQEDLALARGMAPRASLMFTQAWSGANFWFLGASQVLDARHLPDSLSISYGICENAVRGNGQGANFSTRAGANLLDSLLVRLGLAGVGAYASAGDSGSTCNGLPYPGVAWPASSPYLTAVGGTRLTLTRANQRRDEVVWNDREFEPPSDSPGAGGGGYSSHSLRPPYQMGLGIPGHRRTAPDVSAAASSFPGFPVVLGHNWVVDGGTSGAAPLVASAMAVISANLQRRHLPPVGPANGLFYWLAKHRRGAFWDVVHGNNGFVRKVRPHRAKRGYDLASGLGVPQFARVAGSIPAPSPN